MADARNFRRHLQPLVVVEACNGLAFAMFVPFLALWLTGPVGFSPLLAGVIGFGAYAVAGMVGGVIGGWLADRMSRQLVITMGLAGGAMRLGLMAIFPDPVVVAGLIMLGGCVDNMTSPAIAATIADWTPGHQLAEGFGLVRAGRTAALGLGPVIGVLLVGWSFEAVLVASCIARGVACVVTVVFVKDAPHLQHSRLFSETTSGHRSSSMLWLFLCGVGLLALLYGSFESVVPVVLTGDGRSVTTWGLCYTVAAVIAVGIQLPIARRLDTTHHRVRWLLGAGGCYVVGLSLLMMPYIGLIGIGVVLLSVAQTVLNPLEATIVTEQAPIGELGKYQGRLSVVYTVGFGVGPVLGLGLYQYLTPHSPFLISIPIALLGIWCLIQVLKHTMST